MDIEWSAIVVVVVVICITVFACVRPDQAASIWNSFWN